MAQQGLSMDNCARVTRLFRRRRGLFHVSPVVSEDLLDPSHANGGLGDQEALDMERARAGRDLGLADQVFNGLEVNLGHSIIQLGLIVEMKGKAPVSSGHFG